MTNKLPAYFEKYFEQKFGELNQRIDDLKSHVNDEVMELKNRVYKVEDGIFDLKRQIMRIWIAMIFLTPIYIKDSRDYLLSIIGKFIGF